MRRPSSMSGHVRRDRSPNAGVAPQAGFYELLESCGLRGLRGRSLPQRFAVDALERLGGQRRSAVRFDADGVQALGFENAPQPVAAGSAHAARLAIRVVVVQLPEIVP